MTINVYIYCIKFQFRIAIRNSNTYSVRQKQKKTNIFVNDGQKNTYRMMVY